MGGFIMKVLQSEGIRLFVCLFLGMLFMLLIQQEMVPTVTRQIADFAADSKQTKQGALIVQRYADHSKPPDVTLQGSTSSTTLPFVNIPRVNISTQATEKRTNYRKPLWNMRRPNIELGSKLDSANDTRRQFCTDKSKWSKTLSDSLGRITSNIESWKFGHTIECPNFNISEIKYDQPRLKFSINCNKSDGIFDSPKWTYNTSDVYMTQFGDACVDNFIHQCCRGQHRVPNIVHYVWYMRGELTFVGFTSLLGVIRFVKPCAIIFHGDKLPHGTYWDFIVNISPNIIHLKRERPTFFSGQKIKHREHSSDIMRVEALLQYGGIYMDTDTLIVKSLDSLRNYSCVMSNQSSGLMGSAFVMAERNASFIQLWMDGYRYHYNSSKYTYNAMIYPNKVARQHMDLIHIEYATISRPKNMIGGKIYYNEYATYDWSYIYGIHLYSRIYKKPFNEHTIKNMNTTVGSISRHVVFGNKELCN